MVQKSLFVWEITENDNCPWEDKIAKRPNILIDRDGWLSLMNKPLELGSTVKGAWLCRE